MSGEILHVMLILRNQVKLYHWQTMSFSRHKATDDLVTSLDTNIDKFTEAYMGRYGRPKMTVSTGKIKLTPLAFAFSINSNTKSSLSASKSEVPIVPPCAFAKV